MKYTWTETQVEIRRIRRKHCSRSENHFRFDSFICRPIISDNRMQTNRMYITYDLDDMRIANANKDKSNSKFLVSTTRFNKGFYGNSKLPRLQRIKIVAAGWWMRIFISDYTQCNDNDIHFTENKKLFKMLLFIAFPSIKEELYVTYTEQEENSSFHKETRKKKTFIFSYYKHRLDVLSFIFFLFFFYFWFT